MFQLPIELKAQHSFLSKLKLIMIIPLKLFPSQLDRCPTVTLILLLLFRSPHCTLAEPSPSYYYNRCTPSNCGGSLLRFPLGLDPLCRMANLTTSCENGAVFMTTDQNPQIKYKLLDELNETIYAGKSIRLAEASLFGCDPIPPIYAGYRQMWLILGSLTTSNGYTMGTFFNCTAEPQGGMLSKLMRAPCLECGESSSWCYFYNGFTDPILNCRSSISAIPNSWAQNLTGVGNLRRAMQEGFRAEWDSACGEACMDVTGGRYGYTDEGERTLRREFCFCSSSVPNQNCSDGTGTATSSATRHFGQRREELIVVFSDLIVLLLSDGIALGLAIVFGCVCFVHSQRRKMLKNKRELRGKDEQVLRDYLGRNSTPNTSIETFLEEYASRMPTRFSYKQIKKYSNNFSHKLGQGGFSSVFKAKLPNNSIAAVKILDKTEQSEMQFLNEAQTIGQIHHQNLVRLLGFCFEQSRRALVYEFMENGSLDKHIHQNTQDEEKRLSWHQLHEIALGTARGIAYLHEECRSRILHCDIKPHNILLDEKFQPKVSDFGLAQMVNRENSHISWMQWMGTPGYAPPEMFWKKYGPVSEKSDVYSYGMVVLEMVGERRNYDSNMSMSSEMYFPEWAYAHHVLQATGAGGSKWHNCEGEQEENIAKRMELVGLWCIQYAPFRRPSIRDVIDMLQGNAAIDIPPFPFNANMLQYGGLDNNPVGDSYVS